MKKIIISLALCLCAGFAAVAQELETASSASGAVVTKRGTPILPQAGDFAIGVSANPFLDYLGNFFGKTTANSAPTFGWSTVTVYGKYFLEDNRAIRAKLTLNYGSQKDERFVRDDNLFANDPLLGATATVKDVRKTGTQALNLNAGYELRRGRGRLQGFYGGEVTLGYGKINNTYTYANPMTDLNQAPTSTTAWGGVANPTTRTLKQKGGLTVNLGLGGFAGVEYFIAPQISLGGEVGVGLLYTTTGQTETTTEYFNTSTGQVEERSQRSGNPGKNFTFAAKGGGDIFLLFHF
ncbi:MAG: hypothetical protein LBS03_05895 [Bacteroidales bacterium]|jgi:hypothetical protein|nr:hypothetical protein [Bacteroidales bacterium]